MNETNMTSEAILKDITQNFVVGYFEDLMNSIHETEGSPSLKLNKDGNYEDPITNVLMTFFAEGGQCALRFQDLMNQARQLAKEAKNG